MTERREAPEAATPERRPAGVKMALAAGLVIVLAGLPMAAVVWIADHGLLPEWALAILAVVAVAVAGWSVVQFVFRGVLAPPPPPVQIVVVPGARPKEPEPRGPIEPPSAVESTAAVRARRDEQAEKLKGLEMMGAMYESMALRAAKEGRDSATPVNLRLEDAVNSGDLDNLAFAIRAGAEVEAHVYADPTGALLGPALCHAVNAGHHAIAHALLVAGANPRTEATLRSAASDEEVAPLHVACARGDATMVELLLRAGADPAATWKRWHVDGESSAPCLVTAINAQVDPDARLRVTALLLQAGADPNALVRWRADDAWHEAPVITLATSDPRLAALLQQRDT